MEVEYLTQIARDGSKGKNIYGGDMFVVSLQTCVRFVYNLTFQT